MCTIRAQYQKLIHTHAHRRANGQTEHARASQNAYTHNFPFHIRFTDLALWHTIALTLLQHTSNQKHICLCVYIYIYVAHKGAQNSLYGVIYSTNQKKKKYKIFFGHDLIIFSDNFYRANWKLCDTFYRCFQLNTHFRWYFQANGCNFEIIQFELHTNLNIVINICCGIFHFRHVYSDWLLLSAWSFFLQKERIASFQITNNFDFYMF